MASPDMARWRLSWGNPHTEPPAGQPRHKGAVLVQRGEPCPPDLLALKVPGDGYMLGWELVTQKPIRRWSPEAKARTRRRNLRARLERAVPLFADIIEKEELARRPGYFDGSDRWRIDAN